MFFYNYNLRFVSFASPTKWIVEHSIWSIAGILEHSRYLVEVSPVLRRFPISPKTALLVVIDTEAERVMVLKANLNGTSGIFTLKHEQATVEGIRKVERILMKHRTSRSAMLKPINLWPNFGKPSLDIIEDSLLPSSLYAASNHSLVIRAEEEDNEPSSDIIVKSPILSPPYAANNSSWGMGAEEEDNEPSSDIIVDSPLLSPPPYAANNSSWGVGSEEEDDEPSPESTWKYPSESDRRRALENHGHNVIRKLFNG